MVVKVSDGENRKILKLYFDSLDRFETPVSLLEVSEKSEVRRRRDLSYHLNAALITVFSSVKTIFSRKKGSKAAKLW